MRIAIMGTRGVPASYGGFETFAEELGVRLVERGHHVTVYGRTHIVPPEVKKHRGITIRRLPTIRHKYLDTVLHTALSVLDGLFRRFDVVLICNAANAPFALVPRLAGAKVALNVDGLEWRRAKWGLLGRNYYRFCSLLASKLPIVLVSDARVIAEYYWERHRRSTVFIPYGTDTSRLAPGPTLRRFGLEPCGYILYVSRLEPENNADAVITGYGESGLGPEVPLVLVGDAPYASEYKRELQEMARRTPGVMMVGYVFGDGYAELQSNCAVYVQATEVGGTHPALIEAMGRGAAIVANDVPEHREVLGDTGLYFRAAEPASLATALCMLVGDSLERDRLREAARGRAEREYSWARVADRYETLFTRMVSGSQSGR
jgi:glycosyltransferase involved in cell wall biosynthesis